MENIEMTDRTRAALLAAWEREFPTGAPDAATDTDPDRWVDRPPAAPALGPYADVIGLTRGQHERDRIHRARKWVDQTQVHGGDYDAALRELHDATDQLTELERNGQDEQYVELDRGGSRPTRTIYGPTVVAPWHPIP